MDLEEIIKRIYKRVFLFAFIFLVILVSFIFLLRFYSAKLIKQIVEINNLKENLLKQEEEQSKERELNRLALEIKQKTGKELSSILYDAGQKLNRNLDEIQKLLNEKFIFYDWKILNKEIKENELNYSLEVPSKDFSLFYNLLKEEVLIPKIKELKIENKGNNFLINLKIQ